MTKCNIYTRENKIKRITVKGHAKYDIQGKDIVCAGISALIQNLGIGISLVLNDIPNMAIDSGDVNLKLTDDQIEKSYYFTEAFKHSMIALENTYPDNVKVIIE